MILLPPEFPEQAYALNLDEDNVEQRQCITAYITDRKTGETTITHYVITKIERGQYAHTATITLRELEAVQAAENEESVPEVEMAAIDLGLLPFIGGYPNSYAFSIPYRGPLQP